MKKIHYLVLSFLWMYFYCGITIVFSAVPAKPVIAWINPDQTSSNFYINWDMWWGENGQIVKLFENRKEILSTPLISGGYLPQKGTFLLSEKKTGLYNYMIQLCNNDGCVSSDTIDISVRLPGELLSGVLPNKPIIAWLSQVQEPTFSISWDMWWGENGNIVKLEENGKIIDTNSVIPNKKEAQKGTFQVQSKNPGKYTYKVILCNGTTCSSSDEISITIQNPSITNHPIIDSSGNNGNTIPSIPNNPPSIIESEKPLPSNDSHNIVFGEETLRALKSGLPISGRPDISLNLPNYNPHNVQRVMRILPESKWNELFPVRKDIYTYLNFLQSVAKFPGFCNDVAPDAGMDYDTACKTELATLFAHITQETGGHSPQGYLPDNPGTFPEEWKQAFYFIREYNCNQASVGCEYRLCDAHSYVGKVWQCFDGEKYFGRGAFQLSWNFNYGPFSIVMFGDQNILLKNPDLVASDGWLAISSALWFYMTPHSPKPSMHDVVVGYWQPNSSDITSGNFAGFGATTNIINGGIECGSTQESMGSVNRMQYFRAFTKALGGRLGSNLSCANSKMFSDKGSAVIPMHYDQSWDGTSRCQLVAWQSGFNVFIPDSYRRCVEFNFDLSPTLVPILPVFETQGIYSTNPNIVAYDAKTNRPSLESQIVSVITHTSQDTPILPPLLIRPTIRKIEIIKNLSLGLYNTPENFRSKRIFFSKYGYFSKDNNEKKILDEFWIFLSKKGIDITHSRTREIIKNIGMGFASLEYIKDRQIFDDMYSYTQKPISEQLILNEFWSLIYGY